ncbi:MAG: sigma-54-dependent Fis family transcriptional regulator [Pseudomonadota bacterium]
MGEPLDRQAFSVPEHERAVMASWERFMAGDNSPPHVRTVIDRSWRRCQTGAVDHRLDRAPPALDEDGLRQLLERSRDLVSAGEPVMATAQGFLLETGTVMVLTDADGVLLCQEGDNKLALQDAIEDIRFVPGATWSEAACGTNAVGTALETGRAVQVHGGEHFCEGIKRWTCSASVIRDPFDGSILGCVDVSGLRSAYSRHSMALVAAAASRIENQLAQIESEQRYRLLDRCIWELPAGPGDHVLILDRKGRIVRANGDVPSMLRELAGTDEAVTAALDRARWVRSDWLTPVYDGGRQLGSILIAPKAGAPRKMRSTAPQPRPSTAFDQIVGIGPSLRAAVDKARQVAPTDAPVMLLGETGVGKELFARGLHQASVRADGPFIVLNCGGLSRDLLASELFGYIDGAFTGARRGGMVGKIEAAAGGTLFLDEIGEMPSDLQPALLRALEEREICRLGETKPRRVDFRLLTATNRDLKAEIESGRFRADLFYRTAVVSITVPPLRDRRNDLPALVEHFSRQTSQRYGLPTRRFSQAALARLTAHDWPGNVRELRNVVEHTTLTAPQDLVTEADLPEDFATTELPSQAPEGLTPIESAERAAIRRAIEVNGGNVTASARALGLAKSTVYAKMRRYALDPNAMR